MSDANGNGFIYSEAAVARELGIERETAELIRASHLEKNRHWIKKERHIALSQIGVTRMARAITVKPSSLDLSACLLPSLAEKEPADAVLALPEPITYARPAKLRVKRLFENPRVLLATDAAGAQWQVIVGDSSNFVLGMELPAAPSLARPGYYTLVGKLPPKRGRWK